MMYRVLADFLVLIHFLIVGFILAGGLLALKWRWVMWIHLPLAVWGAFIEFFNVACPLTPLENWLRRKGGGLGYEGGFVDQYIAPVLYPAGLDRRMQIIIGIIVLVVNAIIYWRVFRDS